MTIDRPRTLRTAICTISTAGHLFKTEALFHSLSEWTDVPFHCLITDSDAGLDVEGGIRQVKLTDLNSELVATVRDKYSGDRLRWACKPLVLMHLLEQGYDKVIYLDNDIYFYGSPGFLFDLLDDHAVVLTPHFYLADASERQYWLEANFRIGLFNAGFVGVSSAASKSMEWWARCCAYNVRKAGWRGLFDDQRYLDLLPVLFDGVHILKHRGCNVAGWNIGTSPRTEEESGSVVLDGKWPLVFIHFNAFTMRLIMKGMDPMLRPHLEAYFSVLRQFSPEFNAASITRYDMADAMNYLRHLLWSLIRKFD